jgi:hypothetical protein
VVIGPNASGYREFGFKRDGRVFERQPWPTLDIDDNMSQRMAIVSQATVIFAPSAFLTKFTSELTLFSRGRCFDVHD